MANEVLTVAYVYLANKSEKVVPLASVENFHPQNRTDFVRTRKYKVWWQGTKDKHDSLLNAFILLLGTSELDIKNQKDRKRLSYPNKRNMSFSSNCEENERSKPKKTVKQKLIFASTAAIQKENENILLRHLKLMGSKKSITLMSDSEKDDEENHGDDETVRVSAKRSEELERNDRNDESEDGAGGGEPLDGEHEKNTVGRNITAVELNPRRLLFDASRETFILQENEEISHFLEDNTNTRRNTEPRPSTSNFNRSRVLSESNLNVNANRGKEPQLLLNRRRSAPCPQSRTQNEEAPTEVLARDTRDPGRPRVTYVNDEVHIGENIYMHVDIWETIRRKNDSKFVKDLAHHIWGTAALEEKCLDEDRANRNIDDEERMRKILTPSKYQLIKDLLYEKISDAGVSGYARQARMRKVSKYISEKVYYVRSKKYTNNANR